MNGVSLPPAPIPPEAFGWVWSRWIELIQRRAAAESRAGIAESDAEREAAGHVVEWACYELDRFRAETADGFKLGLKFLAERDPAAVYAVFQTAIRDAAEAMANDYRDDLLTRLVRLEAENKRLWKQLADQGTLLAGCRAEMGELMASMRAVVAELGYPVEVGWRQ